MTPTPETHPDWPCWPIEETPVVEEHPDPLNLREGFDANGENDKWDRYAI